MSDYTIPAIQFTFNGKPITLTGPTSSTPNLATFSQFFRFVFTDAIDSIHTISVNTLEVPTPVPQKPACPFPTNSLYPLLASLLQQFSSIFSVP